MERKEIRNYIINYLLLYILGNIFIRGEIRIGSFYMNDHIFPFIISIVAAFLVSKCVVMVESAKLKEIRKKEIALENITEYEDVRIS